MRHISEPVGLHFGALVGPAEKAPAEVVQRAFSLGLAANKGIGLQPDKCALIIIIGFATPV